MAKNTRSRRNKMSVGAQIALGATCVLAVGASAVCGVFAGFHPDAALAFFKGENIYTQASADAAAKAAQDAGYDAGYAAGNKAGHDSGYNVGFEAGKDAILEEQARYTPTPLESGKLYDQIYVNMSDAGFLAASVIAGLNTSAFNVYDENNNVLNFAGEPMEDGTRVIYMRQSGSDNITILYASQYVNREGIVALPGWHRIGKDGLLLDAEGNPLKLKIEFLESSKFFTNAFFSSTPFGAFDPDAQEKYEYKATPLVDGEEYGSIFFTTDESVWAEVAEFVNSTDLNADGDKVAMILQSDNWLVLAYQLSLFDGNDAHKDDIIVFAGNLHDNYKQTVIYTSSKESIETDHMGVIKPGINGVYEDGIFLESIGKYIKQGYKEGESPEIPLLPDELLNRVISSTPLGAYRPVL